MKTLPLCDDDLLYYLDNKDSEYLIDYKNSSLNVKEFILYISNIKMTANIYKDNLEIQDKYDILLEYITSNKMCNIEVLNILYLSIVLLSFEIDNVLYEEWFTKDQLDVFINDNIQIINKYKTFFSSLTLYNLYIHCGKVSNNFISLVDAIEVNDPIYIGKNFVHLLKYQAFYRIFENITDTEFCFFNCQFNEYMFDRNNLYYYFNTPNNIILKLFSLLIDNKE